MDRRQDENVHTYATTLELIKTRFTLNSKNIEEAIDIQVIFHLEFKILNIYSNIWLFFQLLICPFFQTLLRWECAYIYRNLNVHTYTATWMCIHIPQPNNLKMKAFTINSQNKNQEISIDMTFILEIKLQK